MRKARARARRPTHESLLHRGGVWFYVHFYSSADKRKRAYNAVQLTIVFAIALFALSLILWANSVQTPQQAITVSHRIAEGSTIAQSDLAIINMPAEADSKHLITSENKIVGKNAAIPLEKGTLIPESALTDRVTVPHGYTVIDVNLTSSASALSIGDHVKLLASDSQIGEQASGSVQDQATSITLTDDAIVMSTARKDKAQFWELNSTDAPTISVAVRAKDALAIVSTQNNSPIIAIPK